MEGAGALDLDRFPSQIRYNKANSEDAPFHVYSLWRDRMFVVIQDVNCLCTQAIP